MMSFQIDSFPEGWTSSDREFINQLTDLVGKGEEMIREEIGFIGEEIVTPPHNKRSSSFSDNELKSAKAIKLDFNFPQQKLNQNALVMSVGVDQRKQESFITDENLVDVSKTRPKFRSDPSSRISKIRKQQRRKENRKRNKMKRKRNLEVLPPVQAFLNHVSFHPALKKFMGSYRKLKDNEVNMAIFTHPMMGLSEEQKLINEFNKKMMKEVGQDYACLDMGVCNDDNFKQFFAGKDGKFMSDVAILIMTRLIIAYSKQIIEFQKLFPEKCPDFQELQKYFKLSSTFTREKREQDHDLQQRKLSGNVLNSTTSTTKQNSYGTRRRVNMDPYVKGHWFGEILKYVPESYSTEIKNPENTVSCVERKPVLLIVSDETFRNAIIYHQAYIRDSLSKSFDISIICIPRFCFTKSKLRSVFHLTEIKNLRTGDFLWINLGLNNCFVDEESKERFVWRDKQLENFYQKSI